MGAVAIGLIPLPFLDIALLTALQLRLVKSLSDIYEVEFLEHLGQSSLSALVGGTFPVAVRSLTKAIPTYGTLVGAVACSSLAGASTYAVGKVFILHFESGGSLLTLDPNELQGYYLEQFKKGQLIVRGQDSADDCVGVKP